MAWKVAFPIAVGSIWKRLSSTSHAIILRPRKRFGLLLVAHAESLATTPEMRPILLQRAATRFFPAGRYSIIYRLDQKNSTGAGVALLAFSAPIASWQVVYQSLSRGKRNSIQPFRSHSSARWAQAVTADSMSWTATHSKGPWALCSPQKRLGVGRPSSVRREPSVPPRMTWS
jgi:hypothetical protein